MESKMNLRIIVTRISILIILFASAVHAQNNTELNVITIDLDKENLVGMKDIEFKTLLNNKIENDWNIIQSTFNNEFQIPIRIMIYKDQKLIFLSICYNKKTLSDELNIIAWILNRF
jgi:hypothetical protein